MKILIEQIKEAKSNLGSARYLMKTYGDSFGNLGTLLQLTVECLEQMELHIAAIQKPKPTRKLQ